MSQQYHIQSETTKYYIISGFESSGDIVLTVDGKDSIPEHSVRIQLSNFLAVMLAMY